uniref:Uncharacterized protein n=1 Tax=Leptocylindrus danicus TaxID=163516 RepID=A0A7S2P4Y7_9STRA
MLSSTAATVTLLLAGHVTAFIPHSNHLGGYVCRQRGVSLSAARFNEKYFQLEELEDKETATTEILLKSDNTVEFGETDGPRPISCTGTWEHDEDSFKLVLNRTFSAGRSASESTDVGEFTFTVNRTLNGEVTSVGDNFAVTGSINCEDIGNVGYFNMIDTTDERLGNNSDETGAANNMFGGKTMSS